MAGNTVRKNQKAHPKPMAYLSSGRSKEAAFGTGPGGHRCQP
ncbi:hypothetical protein NXV89_22665 [Bacteroides uniformis]|nr:hypothetical protein [Bacteroides uniformis]